MRAPNPTMKRLRWIAEHYPFPVVDQVMWTLAEAVGIHDLPIPPREEEDVAGLLWVAERKLPAHTRYDRYLPWVARQVDDLYRHEVPVGRDEEWDALWVGSSGESDAIELRRRFRSVVDWAESEGVDLGRYGATQAVAEARRWAQERGLKDSPQGAVVHAWDDGWTVQELTTQEQLDAEGDVMQHCVADYRVVYDDFDVGLALGVEDLSGNRVQIFSLRDRGGAPHATMEYMFDPDTEDPPFVSQLRGKQNDTPKPEYLERMVEFRLGHLPDVKLIPVEAPTHADGLRERFAGAFETPEQDRILVYEDGTVLMWEDIGDQLDDLRAEALQKFPGDRPAQRQYVIIALDQVEPSELATEDWARLYGLWLPWAVMVATKGRARIRDTEDEMVNWLAGTRVDPSVCRPFAPRAANVSKLYQRLTT